MCIAIVGQSANFKNIVLNTKGLLQSIVDSNPDGVGVMFAADDGAPTAVKLLSGKEDTVGAWLEEVLPDDDRLVGFHARFTTHGADTLDNCHPYAVDGGYLLHNGVLSIGNDLDSQRSDTWHYCRAFLDGTLHGIVAAPQGLQLLGDHIGQSNRFVILDKTGRMHIVNKHTGVEYENLWFANTYAWDVSTLDPTFRRWTNAFYMGGDPRKAGSTWRGRLSSAYDKYDVYDEYESVEDYLEARDGGGSGSGSGSGEGGVPTLDDYRDSDGSLAYLLSENEEYLAYMLEEFGGRELVSALYEELGAPSLSRAVLAQIAAGDEDAYTAACEHLVYGNLIEVNALVESDKATLLADALIYGVEFEWGAAPGIDVQTLGDEEVAALGDYEYTDEEDTFATHETVLT